MSFMPSMLQSIGVFQRSFLLVMSKACRPQWLR